MCVCRGGDLNHIRITDYLGGSVCVGGGGKLESHQNH